MNVTVYLTRPQAQRGCHGGCERSQAKSQSLSRVGEMMQVPCGDSGQLGRKIDLKKYSGEMGLYLRGSRGQDSEKRPGR